jgi:hypothetical protein
MSLNFLFDFSVYERIGRFANGFDGSRFDSGQDYGEGGTCDA